MSAAAGSPDRGTLRLLVVLVVVMSAVAAFAVGGLIAVSGVQVSWGRDGGGSAGSARALSAAIGRLGADDGAGVATRPSSDLAASDLAASDLAASPQPAPTAPSGAVKHPVPGGGVSPTPTTPAPLRSCSAPPTAAAGGAGAPILIYPLC
ncbi:hypothetical protein FF36_03076 [Frankia torreyi]|uniref:Uncharacterized protein n=1 Tax=Frankia torreyi TaxID=1856 RepID=A0A0D8BEC1_9ACTN|nr:MULTISPECIES: hypothetical protein [Frankia]KJE22546.1 hypothetical protein FF36_03076 [Frankia torreyi]KQM04587.1 hypothetical protein FF86_102413 [Frankia sp. CpI1-P]